MKFRPCVSGLALSFEQAKGFIPNFANPESLPERTNSIDLGVTGPIQKWNTSFLFNYDIFPHSIMRFEAEWTKHNRPMQVGDLILQRAILPPIGFGLCLEFAVRVCSLINEDLRLGFAYETLSGHAEKGISEFYFEDRNNQIFFTIHTFSEPGHWTARVTKRLFALPYQAWCTQQVLKNVRKKFREKNLEKE